MRRAFVMAAALGTAVTGGVLWWRDHRRFGAATVNRIVNPWLVREGVSDVTRGEIALLEHVGRVSGTVRVTPVHPVDTAEGIRIVMPLGSASQWGRNVLAAGHCRLQRGETVIELDTPRVVDPTAVEAIPRLAALGMSWLGFRYLLLRRFAEHEGTLDEGPQEPGALSLPAAVQTEAVPEATLMVLRPPRPPAPAGRRVLPGRHGLSGMVSSAEDGRRRDSRGPCFEARLRDGRS